MKADGDFGRLRGHGAATDLARLRAELERVIQPAALPAWLDQPNDAFGGLKPVELIERGEVDRLWRMLFELRSGNPA